MKFAWKEIRYFKKKYMLIEALVVLLMFMVLFLSGLAQGLSRAVSSAIEETDAHYFVLDESAENLITVSNLDTTLYDQLKGMTEDEVASIDIQRMYITKRQDNEKLDITYFAIERGSFLEPTVQEGVSLKDSEIENAIILDDDFLYNGISLGDTIYDSSTDMEFTVIGFTNDMMYGHTSVGYITTESYTMLRTRLNPKYEQSYHAFAINGMDIDNIKIDKTIVVGKNDIVQKLPGYQAEQTTINMIVWVLVVVSAVVIGIFHYIITLQKEHQFGVMRALGMSTKRIAGALLAQVGIIAVVGALLANLLTFFMAFVLPETMPFYLNINNVCLVTIAFIMISLVSSVQSLIRVYKIDPVIAMGGGE